ncbi:MAG: YdcF family protein [Treponemataceae bacterium]|nr:YdcF family protein [Treponemataceae bacterium]
MGTLIFYISKILRPLLTSPLGIGMVLSFWVLLLLRGRNQLQRWLKGISLTSLALVTGLSLPIVTRLLSQLYEVPLSQIDDVLAGAPYSAILVLGGTVDPAASRPGLVEGNDSFERLIATARLFRLGIAPTVIASGGSGSITFPDEKEAPYMAELLQLMGVPASAIVVEATSRNTYENIINSIAILKGRSPNGKLPEQPILLVSSAWHLPRALAICKKVGLSVKAFSVDSQIESLMLPADLFPDAWALTRSTRLLREWLGLIAYRLLGRL